VTNLPCEETVCYHHFLVRSAATSCALTLLLLLSACGDDPGNHAPTAVITAPTYCVLGGIIDLDGGASTDPDSDIISYRFVIADGTATRSYTSDKVSHTCKIEGLIGVTLFVHDAAGNQDSTSTVVSVRPN
jgi:hypothetical protein